MQHKSHNCVYACKIYLLSKIHHFYIQFTHKTTWLLNGSYNSEFNLYEKIVIYDNLFAGQLQKIVRTVFVGHTDVLQAQFR